MPRRVDLSSMNSLTPVSKEEKKALEAEVQKKMQEAIGAANLNSNTPNAPLFLREAQHRTKSKPGEPDWVLVEEDAQKALANKLFGQ